MANEIDFRNTVFAMCEYLERNGIDLMIMAKKDDELIVGFTDKENMDVLLLSAMMQLEPVRGAVKSAGAMYEEMLKTSERNGNNV